MKKTSIAVLLLLITGFSSVAHADLDDFIRRVNDQAKADMKSRRWESVSDEVTERLAQFVEDRGIHE